jgi:hypothetical protein
MARSEEGGGRREEVGIYPDYIQSVIITIKKEIRSQFTCCIFNVLSNPRASILEKEKNKMKYREYKKFTNG